MGKTAILFSGSAYNVKFSLPSLLNNIVVPNDADIFVLTTRVCKRRKTPATSPIPDCDIDWEAYSKKNATTINDMTELTNAELELIRETFGDRIKGLYVFEDMQQYYNHVLNDRRQMMNVINAYMAESEKKNLPLPYNGRKCEDANTGSIRYTIDQYHHIKKCYEIMEQYEQANNFKYEHVIRMRIDFKAPEVINIKHYLENHDDPKYLYVMGSFRRDPFYWADEFCWFSKRQAAAMLFPHLDRIGLITDRQFNTIYEKENNDFRFSPETQFDLLLHQLKMHVINVRIYRSGEYTSGGDGYDYFNYRFRRDKIDLDYEFKLVTDCKTDINEHLPILKLYAEKCDHITELGVRYGNSTVAFMAARPKTFISYDVTPEARHDYLKMIAKDAGINWELKIMNPSPEDEGAESLIEPTDLLFIDTNHHARQASHELKLHSDRVKRFIIFHDVETFGYGLTGGQGGEPGLWYAINPFLDAYKGEWKIREHLRNNNGLLVLERI